MSWEQNLWIYGVREMLTKNDWAVVANSQEEGQLGSGRKGSEVGAGDDGENVGLAGFMSTLTDPPGSLSGIDLHGFLCIIIHSEVLWWQRLDFDVFLGS